tara:strand:- start:385 stop:972 length:588 start_codon:yes stop_codon:yes gene_type:complete
VTWPIADPAARVTDDYFGHESGRAQHRAWDVAAAEGSAIIAPERGSLLLLYMLRAGDPLPGWQQAGEVLEHKARPFTWYFADRYGACAILLAPTRWWLFAHIDVIRMFELAYQRALDLGPAKWRQPGSADRFIECYSNMDDRPLPSIEEGELIADIGDSGYSTAPHTHLEVIPPDYPGGAGGRIDPATLFPGKAP